MRIIGLPTDGRYIFWATLFNFRRITKKSHQNNPLFFQFSDRNPNHEKRTKLVSKAADRQAVVLPVIGAPFLAATVPLAAAGAIGVYGAYGDTILTLLNSLLGKVMPSKILSHKTT